MSELRFELRSVEDRKRAFEKLREIVLEDLARRRIPTYHVLHIERDGAASNHYMTPVSLEPADDDGGLAIFVQDFLFFLKLLLRLKRVREVMYIPQRPAIVFTYVEDARGEGS